MKIMDRYPSQQFSGDMGGMAFAGQGTVGYNNVLEKYQSMWIDSRTVVPSGTTHTLPGQGAPPCDDSAVPFGPATAAMVYSGTSVTFTPMSCHL
jgi:hypothetical protein